MEDLQILIQTLIDEVKSLVGMKTQLEKMGEKLSLPVTAKLDKSKSRKRLKTDLSTLDKLNVDVTGKLDRSATRKKLKSEISTLKTDPIKLQTDIDTNQLKKKVKSIGAIKVDTEVDGAEKLNDVAGGLDNIHRKASTAVASATLLHQAIIGLERAAKNMVATATELDKQLTDLRMVTGESYEDISRLVNSYNALAKELGSTTAQLLEASSEWLRQGKTIQETEELIRQSMILSKVGAMDADTATQRLTSTMMGYKLAVEDVAGVVDRLTAVDMEAAVSADGIAEALSHTASSAYLAGLELDKIIAYLTIVQETTQKSASVVGESFKSIFARLTKVTNGEAVDDMGEDISHVESTLRSLGIELRASETEFRNIGDVIDEVGQKFNSLDSVVQRQIVTAMGGVYQSENLLALLTNYDKVAKYVDVAANSYGTAAEKFTAYQESVEAHYNTMIASAEALAKQTVPTELLNGLMDAGSAVMDFATNTNLLSIALSSLGSAFAVKGIALFGGKIKEAYGNVSNLTMAFNLLGKAANVSLSADEFNSLLAVTKNLSTAQLKLVVSNKALTTQQRLAILTASGLTAEEAKQTLVTMGLATAEGTTTAATFSLSGAFKALTASIASNPIGFLVVALTTLISVVGTVRDKIKEARQEIVDAGKEAAESAKTLYNLASSYIAMSKAVEDGTGSQEELDSIQDSLISHLREQGVAVRELSGDYQGLRESVIAAAQTQLQTDISKGIRAADIAKEDAVSELDGYFNSHSFYSATGEEAGAAMAYLEELGFTGIDNTGSNGGGTIFLPSVYSTNGGLEDVEFADLLANYEYLRDAMNAVAEEFGRENPVFTVLADAFSEYETAMVDAIKLIDSTNQTIVDNALLAAQNSIQPETVEEFAQFREDLIAAVNDNINFDADGTYSAEDLVDSALGSIEQYKSFISQIESQEIAVTGQIDHAVTNLTDRLKELQSAYDLLETAQQEMEEGTGLSVSTIQALAEANENYLDYIYEENGVIKLNTEAWKDNANAKMQNEMLDIQHEIEALAEQNVELELRNNLLANEPESDQNTSEIEENSKAIAENNSRIRENQGLLAVYGSLYGSITGDLTAYTEALNNFENIANTIDSVAASYASLANLQKTVAEGFTLSLDKILEYAKAYPQILDSATIAANGELALNEAVVNSFIEGKKAELAAQIDTQIAELEADKAVLLAKKEHATAQLELAKAVINGESEMSSEFAAYKINLGNAMVEALIAMQVDEADAYKLATAAMAGNEEEFARVAAECFENVDENAVKAAYSMAQAFFTNSYNSSLSIAEIAEQAHQTALAIAGMVNGVVAGTSQSTFNGTGGIYTGGYSFSGVDATFDGVDYDYQSQTISLDDYIASLELDISDYENAISQIDGQIATLQALKNTPFEKFQNLVSNASDIVGGKDTDTSGSTLSDAEEAEKIVKEYTAAIDEYYDALKRLEAAQERRKSLEKKLEHTDDFSKKIFIASDLVGAYEAEAEAEKNLMAAKQATIAANVGALRRLGFQVDYDSSTNKLFIKNLEHLNELTASTAGEYDTLQDATNALRQETEELIEVTEQLNSDNIAATETIEDLGYQVLETKNDIVSYIEEIYNEQVEAYREIIDLRKELIESAKDEYDYEADIADKVKEIADLQARIDQLALDDSRSALAERRALEEELAELQADLSQTQSDHSTEAQLEALDKLAEDYEKTAEEDIAILKDTVNATESVWNTFYDTILGKNVTVGDSINAEIVNAWLRAAEAVKTYGTSVNDLSDVSTVIGTLPKFHTGGVVSESNLGNNELLAVLEEDEVVFTKAQYDKFIENRENGIAGMLDIAVGNMAKSMPAASNVVNSFINNNSSDDNSSLDVSPHIEINFSHTGIISERDLKKYYDEAADVAIDKINEAFRQKGIINNRSSRLRPG